MLPLIARLFGRLSSSPTGRLAAGAAISGLLAIAGALIFSGPGAISTTGLPYTAAPNSPNQTVETPADRASAVDTPFEGIADPPPPEAERSAPVTHVVAEGEVLWAIAERYHLRSESLVWANDIDNADLIVIGHKLLIPPVDGAFYTVQPDDRLTDIASRYGVDLNSVARYNQVSTIQEGTDIFLPGARPIRRTIVPPAQDLAHPLQPDNSQAAAVALPPIPLPANIADLLSAGWLKTGGDVPLFRDSERNARQLHALPAGVRLERLEGFKGGRIEVRDPGNGTTRQAMTGWVDAISVDVGKAPSSRELPLAYPADTAMDISHVFAPYRTQLDGTAYAEANCGPVAISMAMDAFGVNLTSAQARAQVLNAQRIWGNNVGTLITALAATVEGNGLKTHGLYNEAGGLDRWTTDDIKAEIESGRPVVVQTRYRSLPGRGGALYFGDHYILVTGVVPGGFLYNDPINHDGIGWDRVISADRLYTAMNASAGGYAYTAFSVSR